MVSDAPVERRALLRAVAPELGRRRPELMAVMAHEACKTLAEGDSEVSEAVDMAAYYAEQIPGLGRRPRAGGAGSRPLGVVLVTPPWNFPLAIPAGGVLAALAAGNAVVLKAPPQTPQCAYAMAEARVGGVPGRAGVPTRCCSTSSAPRRSSASIWSAIPGIDAIVLTGARETAELFRRLARERRCSPRLRARTRSS